MKFITNCIILILVCMSSILSAQQDRILDYDVILIIKEDRSIEIREFIKVDVTGNGLIKRGITRSIPTKRELKTGTINMRYDILEITRDDQEEPYNIIGKGKDQIIRIGDADVFLEKGVHTYMIHYQIPNQIESADTYDFLIWDVIRTDIPFFIDDSSVKLFLPNDAPLSEQTVYVGAMGATNETYTMTDVGNNYTLNLKRLLSPNEGMTIDISFEKGVVDPPSWLSQYGTILCILLGMIVLVPYYVYTWWKYGQDPKVPPSGMIYESPNDLSPASVSYIHTSSKDITRSYTASIISLATKGYLKIQNVEGEEKEFKLVETQKADAHLPDEEYQLHSKLFENSNEIVINGKYNSDVKLALAAFKKSLSNQYNDFIMEGHNLKFVWAPMLISLFAVIAAMIAMENSTYTNGLNIIAIVGFIIVSLVGLFLYIYLIQQPTVERLELKSRIKGFKNYLGLVGKFDDDGRRPERTTAHFESFLPYAYALGVSELWSNQFRDVLEKSTYDMEWANGVDMNSILYTQIFFNDFSRQYAYSAVSPSDTGAAGGGFAGGGGFSGGSGGGGVGGW